MFWNKKKANKNEVPNCFAQTYGVELFLDKIPDIPVDDLTELVRKRCGNVDLVINDNHGIGFAFKNNIVKYVDKDAPAQILIMVSDTMIDPKSLEMSFYQSWSWKEARSIVSKCKHCLLITDVMASRLDYPIRLEMFQKTLYSIVELIPCLAINWRLSQQLVNPEKYLANKPESEDYDLLYGAVNVRLFNIEGTNGEMIMDTLGLGALGLPDWQCHFKDLNPTDVANILYVYADYLFKNGDIIENGHTIQGITEDQKWKCQHEISMLEPKRTVIDVNAGKPYVAGKRK